MQIDANENVHWFAFTFLFAKQGGPSSDRERLGYASCYAGYQDKSVTLARIAEAKQAAKATNDAILTGCSYLGFMSRNDFTKGETTV